MIENKPDWLPELVLLNDYQGVWEDYLAGIYKIFKDDFVNAKAKFRNKIIKIKKHPIEDGKEATFWHLISTGSTESERLPDLRRCERISWIKPTINHEKEEIINVWPQKRKNKNRMAIWYESEEFMIILDIREEYFLLWTTFMVTEPHMKRKYQKEYMEFIKQKPPQNGTVS